VILFSSGRSDSRLFFIKDFDDERTEKRSRSCFPSMMFDPFGFWAGLYIPGSNFSFSNFEGFKVVWKNSSKGVLEVIKI
jgi:hypothetical protein